MKILVIGAGSVGRAVAHKLSVLGHDVTIVDRDPDAIRVSLVPDADWVLADACSPTQLEEAGARDADAVAAVTGDDKVNLVVSLLSKTEFAVPQVIARANHPSNEWMYDEAWGVDVMASTPAALTTLVEEAVSVGEAVQLLALDSSSTSVYKLEIPAGSPQIGSPAVELSVPAPLVLGAVVQDGTPVSVDTSLPLRAGDEVLIICPQESEVELAELEAGLRGESLPT